MTKLTKDGRAALESLNTGSPVQTFPDAVADPLLEAGYVRQANVDPAPRSGKALNLTARGRGALAKVDTAPPAA